AFGSICHWNNVSIGGPEHLCKAKSVSFSAITASLVRLGWQIQRANDPNRTMILTKVTLLSVAEQAAGIIVGCMPVFPAFFRHVADRKLKAQSSKSRTTDFERSTFVFGNKNPIRDSLKTSPVLNGEYKELDDLENGRKPIAGDRRTITTVEGCCGEPPTLEEVAIGLNQDPKMNCLVSKSVQVESHPRTEGGE
ncbi:MAG: hypothetical protein Q9187_006846, partial [Circinaria calcarea]